MNPNSQHQLWSLWTFVVTPPLYPRPYTFAEVKLYTARFAVKAFGRTGQAKVEQFANGQWRIQVRVEGAPVHDPGYTDYMKQNWTRFFVSGFGIDTRVKIDAKLEAGDAQNGQPRDQLIIMPTLAIGVESL